MTLLDAKGKAVWTAKPGGYLFAPTAVADLDGDGSPELVRSEFPWATLVEPGANLGFGSAVNLVAERSRSDWIAPSNADVELSNNASTLRFE